MRYEKIPDYIYADDPRCRLLEEIDEFLDCKDVRITFADDIIDQFNKAKRITFRQYNCLVDIYYEYQIENWKTDNPQFEEDSD